MAYYEIIDDEVGDAGLFVVLYLYYEHNMRNVYFPRVIY